MCYTDGGCINNPGPCGAGAVIQFGKGGKIIERSESLGIHTNNIGELWGIWLALHTVQSNSDSKSKSCVTSMFRHALSHVRCTYE